MRVPDCRPGAALPAARTSDARTGGMPIVLQQVNMRCTRGRPVPFGPSPLPPPRQRRQAHQQARRSLRRGPRRPPAPRRGAPGAGPAAPPHQTPFASRRTPPAWRAQSSGVAQTRLASVSVPTGARTQAAESRCIRDPAWRTWACRSGGAAAGARARAREARTPTRGAIRRGAERRAHLYRRRRAGALQSPRPARMSRSTQSTSQAARRSVTCARRGSGSPPRAALHLQQLLRSPARLARSGLCEVRGWTCGCGCGGRIVRSARRWCARADGLSRRQVCADRWLARAAGLRGRQDCAGYKLAPGPARPTAPAWLGHGPPGPAARCACACAARPGSRPSWRGRRGGPRRRRRRGRRSRAWLRAGPAARRSARGAAHCELAQAHLDV